MQNQVGMSWRHPYFYSCTCTIIRCMTLFLSLKVEMVLTFPCRNNAAFLTNLINLHINQDESFSLALFRSLKERWRFTKGSRVTEYHKITQRSSLGDTDCLILAYCLVICDTAHT